jgi:hypothetical protein
MSDASDVPNEKVIYLHGFAKQELYALVDLIKKSVADPKSIAFATSTKNNLKLTVAALIQEVRKDHHYMTAYEAAKKAGLPPPPIPKD